jgi:hypothetical protein
MTSTRRKADLYILSLGLLFIFLIIITIKAPADHFSINSLVSWARLLWANLVSILSAILLVYAAISYYRFDFDLKGATDIPFEIKKIEGIDYEHLTFLATYIVPLISFDFESGRQMIVLSLLLIVMGIIYIKTDLFYANPSLALLNFRIYRADGSFKNGNREGIILISREKLSVGQKVTYIKLDDRIYYAKGVRP